MRRLILLTLLSIAGCSSWTAAQIELVTQARRGIALIRQDDQRRNRIADELNRLRRQRLDEAFDSDVREREKDAPIDGDWVIEARRAYAVALDAYAKTRAADDAADAARTRNLAAIDAALGRLQYLQSVQQKLTSTILEPEGQP